MLRGPALAQAISHVLIDNFWHMEPRLGIHAVDQFGLFDVVPTQGFTMGRVAVHLAGNSPGNVTVSNYQGGAARSSPSLGQYIAKTG